MYDLILTLGMLFIIFLHKYVNLTTTSFLPNLTEKIEYVQYSECSMLQSVPYNDWSMEGTSLEKINTSLGWESLNSHRWGRRRIYSVHGE